MIFSAELLLSDDQDLAQAAGAYASTNHLDLGAAGTPYGAVGALRADRGTGRPVPFEVIVTEAFDNLTSLQVDLEVDDNDAFSSATVVHSETWLLADLVVGKNLYHQYWPTGIDERYFRLNYTITGTTPTTGKVTAGISGGRDTNTF